MTAARTQVLVGLGQGLRFTESPRWRDGRLWFLDIHDCAIKAVDLAGRLETIAALPFKPNGFGFRRNGDVMVGDALGLTVNLWRGAGPEPLADLKATAVFCLSDGLVDASDRMYVGDIGYNFWDPQARPAETCVIARIDGDGTVTRVADGLSFPNGMAISPDGRTLFVGETGASRLTAFTIAADGSLSERRTFAHFDQTIQPDGIALDAAGAIWVANPAGEPAVLRVLPGGEVTERIELDVHAYAVAMGGPDGRTLFISASASHDPAEIAQNPSATILVARAEVPAAGFAG